MQKNFPKLYIRIPDIFCSVIDLDDHFLLDYPRVNYFLNLFDQSYDIE